MSDLFKPFKVHGIELKNRIVVSPMCQYSSIDGFANDWHFVHLGSRAVGGASLVMSEATAVSPEGRITPADLGIWKDEHIDFLKRITHFIEMHDSIPGIQLAHAGRKASRREPWNGDTLILPEDGGWQTIAPSAVPFNTGEVSPKALTIEDIQKVKNDFQVATVRAFKAGFKVVEIHAAHGYLIHEFLSPLSNKRNDEYGGSFDNRVRILLEIIDEVKKVWPADYPLFVRISATDWVEGAWSIDDSILLSRMMKEKGVDLVDCSSGGIVPGVKINAAPGYQVPFAEAVKKNAGIATAAVGIITTAEQAEEIISTGKADLVFLAREMLRDPYFPKRAAFELRDNIKWQKQYERAKRIK